MEELLHVLSTTCGWDWCLESFDGSALILASGTSMERTRPVAMFSGVRYIGCPTEFSHASFRLASFPERDALARVLPLQHEHVVVAIEVETMTQVIPHVFFVVADSFALLIHAQGAPCLPGAMGRW